MLFFLEGQMGKAWEASEINESSFGIQEALGRKVLSLLP